MPHLSTAEPYDSDGYSGAPVKLIFCLAGSILALYLNTMPSLLLLTFLTSLRAFCHLKAKLLIKVWLAIIAVLFLCLAGVAWLPSPTVFQVARGGGVGPEAKAFINSLPPISPWLSEHQSLVLCGLSPLAAILVYFTVRAIAAKDLWYFVKGFLISFFILMSLLIVLAMSLTLASIQMPRGLGAIKRTIAYSIMPTLRIMISANLALVLVLTTPSASMSRFLAAVLRTDWLFIPMTVVLRFLAAFLAQLGLVREALMVRTRRGLFLIALTRPAILWRGLLVPMTFQTLKTADQLAISLEMKGLSRRALFWARPKLLSKRDLISLLAGLGTAGLSLLLRWPKALSYLAQQVPF
ncbi:MAG: energy-coupling factor transporter transmembrane protein EcfT [Deltaproteobacteria bacterium]|jgi:energy-coupling factor transporter transmembrane protein EcfT|nr:energy-coupling factor transporter transmembrane protein EcfT [Deltaproteobacteria bacterium]